MIMSVGFCLSFALSISILSKFKVCLFQWNFALLSQTVSWRYLFPQKVLCNVLLYHYLWHDVTHLITVTLYDKFGWNRKSQHFDSEPRSLFNIVKIFHVRCSFTTIILLHADEISHLQKYIFMNKDGWQCLLDLWVNLWINCLMIESN